MAETTTHSTMKAMQIDAQNKANTTQLPRPKPQENEVLVKVVSSALDSAAIDVRNKTFVGKFLHATVDPLILGWHYAGIVVEVGNPASSSDYTVGDEVWGFLAYDPSQSQGAFSEYIRVAQDECALKPKHVSFRQAAAISTEAVTALQAMRDSGNLEKGMHILVVGAGGGVGSMAVAIAKCLGAQVTASCSTKDVKRVKLLGADTVLDRSNSEDPLLSQKYDVIFDTPSVYSPKTCLKSLHPGGSYVATYPTWSLVWGFLASMFTSKTVTMVGAKSKKDDLELVGEWLERDGMQVQIDSIHKVTKLEEAFASLDNRTKAGRIVINVADGWN